MESIMNKFAAVLLGACLLSGSASWGMNKAIECFVDKNCARLPKVALLICAPLAYGCFDYIRTSRKSAETQKLAEKIASEHEEYKEIAQKCIADLKTQERSIKYASIVLSCIFGCLIAGMSNSILDGDLIAVTGITICLAVFNIGIYIEDLQSIVDKSNSMLLNN